MPRRVMDFRLSNNIASTFTKSTSLRLKEGYVPSPEVAQCLGVTFYYIHGSFLTYKEFMKNLKLEASKNQ